VESSLAFALKVSYILIVVRGRTGVTCGFGRRWRRTVWQLSVDVPRVLPKDSSMARSVRCPLISTPISPLEFIAIDVLGPLPITTRGNRFVLCITDRFSKMSVAVPLKNQSTSVVAQILVDRWIAVFGIPVTLLSDNGPAFASKFFGVLTHALEVKQVFTSAYRPTTNGQVER
jgi:transposase InsO family protein